MLAAHVHVNVTYVSGSGVAGGKRNRSIDEKALTPPTHLQVNVNVHVKVNVNVNVTVIPLTPPTHLTIQRRAAHPRSAHVTYVM